MALIFERQPDLGPVGFHLAIRDHHVLLDDFCYAEFAQGVRGCFYGCLGRLLPRLCTCPNQRDDLCKRCPTFEPPSSRGNFILVILRDRRWFTELEVHVVAKAMSPAATAR